MASVVDVKRNLASELK